MSSFIYRAHSLLKFKNIYSKIFKILIIRKTVIWDFQNISNKKTI